MKTLQPLHDRILVRRLPDEPHPLGIVLVKDDPNTVDVVHDLTDKHSDYRRIPIRGEILAVGPGKYDDKFKWHSTTVKPGQCILFTNWNDWEDAPAGLYMIREADVMGFLPKAKRRA